jgi:hypothetical protein
MQHARVAKKGWLVLAVPLVAVVVIGHLFVFYRLSSHLAWTLATALILLLVLTHSGVFAAIYAFFKRWGRGEL